MFYTSLPVIFMGVLDQDVNEASALRYPQLYTPGLRGLLFSKSKFMVTAIQGVLTSFALVGLTIGVKCCACLNFAQCDLPYSYIPFCVLHNEWHRV